jgi:type IV pilus assembly protein PilA
MRANDERGFSLIEMLVVCITIGVLAAIALPAFLNQSKKASDAHAKSHVNTAAQTIEALRTQGGTYDVAAGELAEQEPSLAGAVNLEVSGTASTFTIGLDSDSGVHYELRRTAVGTQRDCSPAGQGSCRAAADAAGNRW